MSFSSKLSKQNNDSIGIIFDQLRKVENENKSIREAMEALAARVTELEKINDEYCELRAETEKAERRFNDGVANVLNYDYSVASKPLNGRADK
jgi:septal ring factor EnvC (AmiA/AmiB activator)